MEKNKWERRYIFVTLAALCALAVFVCLFLYRYDNKYTTPGPKGANGVLILDEQALERHPVVFLVEGWAYYGGRLLTPEDFAGSVPAPDEYMYIGQYGGFDAGDLSAPPHGSASYRLTICLPDEPRTYLLELPEIYSAYRAYINGKLVQTMGDPDPGRYRPETGNRAVTIEAGGRIDILIAATDFSHIYSGMVYPPAFGEPEAVSALLNARLIFRSIFVAFALAIGALALLIGVASRKNAQAILYGLLCLFFVGYTGYPVLKTLLSGFYPFYAIENVSFCAMLAAVMLLQKTVYGQKEKWSRFFIGFGVFMCFLSAILPFALTVGSLWVMGAYSCLIMAYEWVTAAYLTFAAVRNLLSNSVHSKTLLGGILVFDAALVMDRLLPLFEPVVTGWFPELASFALVLSIGAAVAKEVAAKYKDSAVLEERANSMERLSAMQKSYYPLLNEKIMEAKTARHDLRHHFTVINSFAKNRRFDRLEAYIEEFQSAIRSAEPIRHCDNDVADVLAQHYVYVAAQHDIDLTLNMKIAADIKIPDADLCSLLSNLLENAVEACRRQVEGRRFISLSIGQKASALSIRIVNSTDGTLSERGGVFPSTKDQGGKGYGLASIRAVARRYNGDAAFRYDKDKQIFISTVLLTFNERFY